MTYDALKRLITVQNPFGLMLTYTYDAVGNRTQMQDSLGGVTTYIYDADNELTSEQFGGSGQTPLRIDMTYNADREILTETRFSDLAGTQVVVNSNYTYNADGQVTSLLDRNGGGTVVASFTYTYDLDNRVATEVNMGMTTTYTYDADSELTEETSPLATIYYTYDAGGNRTSNNSVIGSGNQLLSDNDWIYTYDAVGNLIEKVGVATGPDKGLAWTYTYNNRNQMTSAVEVKGGTTLASVTFTYDVFGNRIEEDASGSMLPTQVARFAYDRQNVWADLDGSNNLVMRRVFLGTVDSVAARISASGTVAWYLVDRLGSVNVLTDSTGAVIDRILFDGYGNILSQTNPAASDRYLFTGREFDRVTGLQYNRARYYDPTTGRWTSRDPVGFDAGDTNLYRYVSNGPTGATDPTGKFLFAVPLVLLAAVGAVLIAPQFANAPSPSDVAEGRVYGENDFKLTVTGSVKSVTYIYTAKELPFSQPVRTAGAYGMLYDLTSQKAEESYAKRKGLTPRPYDPFASLDAGFMSGPFGPFASRYPRSFLYPGLVVGGHQISKDFDEERYEQAGVDALFAVGTLYGGRKQIRRDFGEVRERVNCLRLRRTIVLDLEQLPQDVRTRVTPIELFEGEGVILNGMRPYPNWSVQTAPVTSSSPPGRYYYDKIGRLIFMPLEMLNYTTFNTPGRRLFPNGYLVPPDVPEPALVQPKGYPIDIPAPAPSPGGTTTPAPVPWLLRDLEKK
jgi:RHS repeat-associated protein